MIAENYTKIRVRYGETDQMGIVNNAVYPSYFEIGRTELMRARGVSYREMEEQGILMPLKSLKIEFIRPAKYDDVLTIRTYVEEIPKARIRFFYEIITEDGTIITRGETVLAFLMRNSNRPSRAPERIVKLLLGNS